MANPRRQLTAMSSAVGLQSTVASLRRQAEALAELQRRCAQLRDARERSHAQLDAVAAAIDDRIDEWLRIGELLAVAGRSGRKNAAVTALERQVRRLALLRSQVLALYVAAGTRSGA